MKSRTPSRECGFFQKLFVICVKASRVRRSDQNVREQTPKPRDEEVGTDMI